MPHHNRARLADISEKKLDPTKNYIVGKNGKLTLQHNNVNLKKESFSALEVEEETAVSNALKVEQEITVSNSLETEKEENLKTTNNLEAKLTDSFKSVNRKKSSSKRIKKISQS